MTELLDARPGGLDAKFRPGDPFPVTLSWPAGALAGRTFTSTLGAASLGVVIVGDIMTITATAAQTAAAVEVSDWKLIDTTPADDVTVMVGHWAGSEGATPEFDNTVTVVVGTATVQVTLPGASAVGDLVVAGSLTVKHPLIFWQHPVAQTLANAVWTPIAWNSLISTVGTGWTTYVPASTTIAAGSNGAVLPQGTINVASTAGFASATSTAPAYLVVRISSTDRVIQYTGTAGGNQFTGCTFGVGTLATGNPIAQANVEFTLPSVPAARVGPLVAELAWGSNAVGLRGTRVRAVNAFAPGVHLNAATDVRAAGVASADPAIRSITVEQPAFNGATKPYRIEGYQSSTGSLDTIVDQLAAPRLVVQALSSF